MCPKVKKKKCAFLKNKERFVIVAFKQDRWKLFITLAIDVTTKFWIELGYKPIWTLKDYGIGFLAKY